jgi:hypothetical protein
MDNLGKTEVRRGPATSSSHFIICWLWFVGVAAAGKWTEGLRASVGRPLDLGGLPTLSHLFRSRRRQPIPALVEAGLPAAPGQRARWVFPRR